MTTTRAAIAVRLLEAAAGGDAGLVDRLSGLVNEVYASAEGGLWREGATRTTPSEVAGLIDAREIAVATVDGRLAGAIRVRALWHVTGEFGMLAADPDAAVPVVGRLPEAARLRDDGVGQAARVSSANVSTCSDSSKRSRACSHVKPGQRYSARPSAG